MTTGLRSSFDLVEPIAQAMTSRVFPDKLTESAGRSAPVVRCSTVNCPRPATRMVTVEMNHGRAAGEPVAMWVCDEHLVGTKRLLS
jgi:hypothetical protein